MFVIDVIDPQAPVVVDMVSLPGGVQDISIFGTMAYVVCQTAGLHAVDIGDPLAPEIIASVDVPELARGVFANGDYVFAVSTGPGLHVIQGPCGAASDILPATAMDNRLLQAYPTPFNAQTTIAFDLPKEEAVRLAVYDMSGRLVRHLVTAEVRTLGRHEVLWSGKDDAGRSVASGAYFYRLEAGEYSETRRMVLVK